MNSELVNMILTLIGFVIIAAGVICVFDARNLSKRWFGFGDRNEGTKTFKIIGFAMAIIGGLLIILV